MSIYPWQQSQWNLLQRSIIDDCVPHALLLNGQAGLGKKEFALQLTKALLCEKKSSCDNCKSCHLLSVGNHPDFYLIEATGEKIKAIKVDQVRELSEKTSKTPAISSRQVVLLQQVDLLNTAASNALLKTLEEPLGDVVLILVSDDHTILLPTILSRCQSVLFQTPEKKIVEQWLREEKIELLDLSLRLHLAAGSPLLAIDDSMSAKITMRQTWLHLLMDLFKHKQTVVQISSQVMSNTVEQLLSLYFVVSDVVRDDFIDGSYSRELQSIKQQMHLSQWFEFLEAIKSARGLMKQKIALNQQLVWESILNLKNV